MKATTMQDYRDTVEWITTRWNGRKWDNAQSMYPDFANYPEGLMLRAARWMFHKGNTYQPSPAELVKTMRDLLAKDAEDRKRESDPHELHPRSGCVWGIIDEDDQGVRTVQCSLCHAYRKGHQYLTESEREQRARQRLAPEPA